MKPGCGKCFKVAEKNGNEYICPSCGDTVAKVKIELPVEAIVKQLGIKGDYKAAIEGAHLK